MGNYPWKTEDFDNRRFPEGFDGTTDEIITTINITSEDERFQDSHDFIQSREDNYNGWTYEDMILHLLDKDKNWRIEIYESEGNSYEEWDGLWNTLESGSPGGSSFYLYDKMNGLRREED